MDINKLIYFLKVPYLLPQRTWPSDAAKLGLPVPAKNQLCPVWLTIFVNRFIIARTAGELCPGLFVIRWEQTLPATGRRRVRAVFFADSATYWLPGTPVE
jgi:hypothetical protein